MDVQSPDTPHTTPRPAMVKSAVRVLAILAYIDRCRAPVNVSSVTDALGFPQSSTSALLRSLQATGYLRYDPNRRRYSATERVALLGSWVSAGLVQEGPVLRMTAALAERHGCAASLWTRGGSLAECLHLNDPARVTAARIGVGSELPLATSAPGIAFLSLLDDGHVRRLLHRLNAEAPTLDVIRLAELLPRVNRMRQDGFARSGTGEKSMVAALLSSDPARAPLVIALSGPELLVEQAVPALLRAAGHRTLNYSDAPAAPPPWSQSMVAIAGTRRSRDRRGMERIGT